MNAVAATALRLLALDTSTDRMSVAAGDGTRMAAWHGEGGPRASTELMGRITEVLAQLGWTLPDLDAIAFGQGPGSFTGLRSACAVAQGLAFGARRGQGVPVLPVCTLQTLAQQAQDAHPSQPVLALLDARMNEVYAGVWLPPNAARPHWTQVLAPCLVAPAEVSALAAQHAQQLGPLVLCGNAHAAYADALPGLGHPAVAAWLHTAPDAACALPLAFALYAAGGGLSPDQAQPVYIRDKVALTTAERMAAKAMAA